MDLRKWTNHWGETLDLTTENLEEIKGQTPENKKKFAIIFMRSLYPGYINNPPINV